ncbi:signal peptidase I [Niveibacterium sp. 24ML]|uniref:signal peptidase I n=1 Tax=Niveibacterium sp. 24ML TaxID=2985512 RepID=UPI002270120B|nr:signal peptidase I [Niveibacterium sp. 24ML]MCX9158283.1 signal peptidase I [Niveibacterium sp. 24ML]
MDFALILFVLSIVTGVLWAADRFVFRKKRPAEAPEPIWVEWGAGFFPILLAIFLLRSFLVEPFRIPSGSMIPTLLVGDFILVNKFAYGIRLPVIDKKVIDYGTPKRGDVVVFRYPQNPAQDYIKRIVGLPGDKIEYINKRLTINGELIAVTQVEDYLHADRLQYSRRFNEKLGDIEHQILNDADMPAFVAQPLPFAGREHCTYTVEGVRCTVPAGHYFAMGDNRDQSSDSRVWGFVPDENLRGRAFFIWFHFGEWSRIGSFH